MRYEGNTCPGCGEVFTQDDDVVVCPECATAQHRHCYNKKGECVNAHLHGEDFQWVPEKGVSERSTSTLINQGKDKKTFQCPSCGNYCDPDKGYCDKCGTKFMLFGMNIAKELQKEQKRLDEEKESTVQNEDDGQIPYYKPPFEIGVGEGFDEKEQWGSVLSEDAQRVQQEIINSLMGEDNGNDNGELLFKGPFRADDKIEDVSANAIGSFVRNEAFRYIEKFRKIGTFKSNTFNWGAFFFAPYWFFYRRLIKPGIIFMTVQLLIAVFTTYFSIDMMAAMTQLESKITEGMTEQAIAEFMLNELSTVSGYMMACMFALVVMHLAAGFVADRLYKKYVFDNVRIMQKSSDMKQALLHAAKNGGASVVLGIGSFMAYQILTYLIGTFFV